MSRKIAIAAAALISMGMMAASATSASAKKWGHGYSSHHNSCYTKKISYPVYKTVWRTKKVAVSYGCGWETIKYRKTIKVWRSSYKKVCH